MWIDFIFLHTHIDKTTLDPNEAQLLTQLYLSMNKCH